MKKGLVIYKIVIIFLIFSMLMLLVACTNNLPDKTVADFFDALKKSDIDTARGYLSTESGTLTYEDDQQKLIIEKLLSKLDYQIISTSIDNETAVVKVKITSPDLVKITAEMIQDLLSELFATALSGETIDDNKSKEKIQQYYEKRLADSDLPLISSEIEMKLSYDKNKKDWLIEPDESLGNAITGNASKAFTEMTDNMAGEIQEQEIDESSVKPDSNIYSINQEASIGRAAITVLKSEKSQGDGFWTPKSGMEYVIVTIKERNIAKEDFTLNYNPFFFKIQNSKGQIVDPEIIGLEADTQLGTGQLVNNGEVTGTVVFQVPQNDDNLIFLFAPDGDPLLRYKLNVESAIEFVEPAESEAKDAPKQAAETSTKTGSKSLLNGDAILGIWERYGDKYSGMQAKVQKDGSGYVAMTCKVTDEAAYDGYSTKFTRWIEIKCTDSNKYSAEENYPKLSSNGEKFELDFIKVKITLSSDGKTLTVDSPNGTQTWKKI